MHSEVRRPASVNLDRFVASLDQRLRDEVRNTRRVTLPIPVSRFLRAVKIRWMAFLQGGAMALTALAVILAVGFAPSVGPHGPQNLAGPLARPDVNSASMLLVKAGTTARIAAMGVQSSDPMTRGILE